MDDDGVYWADSNSGTPGSSTSNVTNGTLNASIWKAFDWTDDMNTYQTKPVMSIRRTATGGISLGWYVFDTMAIGRIGGTANDPSAPLTWYSWYAPAPSSNSGLSCSSGYTPILRITSGTQADTYPLETPIYWSCMPGTSGASNRGGFNTVQRLGNSHATGGEINQYTGDIYMVSAVGGEVDDQSSTSRAASSEADWTFTVWDPNTGKFSQSGSVQPGDWYDGMTTVPQERVNVRAYSNGTGNSTPEAPADFAMDADGNVYITVINSVTSSSSGNMKIVRMEPARNADGDIVNGTAANPWRYYVVSTIVKDPTYQTSNVTWSNAPDIWGNAFMNGQLLAGANISISNMGTVPATANIGDGGGARMVKFDPMNDTARPVWSTNNIAPTSTGGIYDNASPQQAQVIRGELYNDLNGDGQISADEPGLYNQTVALYNADGVLLGTKQTDTSGTYSFIVSGSSERTYYVRPVQVQAPLADGTTLVNAVQTWGEGSQESSQTANGLLTNTAAIQCYNSAPLITDGGACYGAQPAVNADPPVGARGSTSDKSTWLNYATVTMSTSQAVPTADFGFTIYGSYGDSAAGPVAAGVPAHVSIDPAYAVQMGANPGLYTGPATNQSHTTDDGVTVKTADGTMPLQGAVLAATRTYTLTSPITAGSAIQNVSVEGWVSGAGNNTWNTTPKWTTTPVTSGGTATGPFQFQASGSVTGAQNVQFRANASSADINQPTNANGQYYAGTNGTPSWTTPGEIEDYQFQVADSVYRPAVKTASGSANFTVDGQTIAGTSATFTSGASTVVSVSGNKTLTATAPDATWTLQKAELVDIDTGAVLDRGLTTSNPSGGAATTISWTPVLGDDVTLQLTYSKAADPTKSTLTVDPPSTTVGNDITVTATVKDVNGDPLGGQTVTFAHASSDTSLNAATCDTDATTGACSVTITSTVAKTYPNEVSATIFTGGSDKPIGSPSTPETSSPQTVTFTPGVGVPENSSMSVTPSGPLTVASTPTRDVKVVVKDANENLVTGQDVRFTLTGDSSTTLTDGTSLSAMTCKTLSDGSCTVTMTSTKAGGFIIGATIQDPTDPDSWVGVSNSPVTVYYTAGDVCAANSSVEVTDNDALNDGVDTDEVTGHTADCFDNPRSGTIKLSTTDTGLTLANNGVITTNDQGVGTVTGTSLQGKTYTVKATVGTSTDEVNGSPVSLNFTTRRAVPDHSTLTLSSTSQDVGTVVTATIFAGDPSGTPVAGTNASFNFDLPTTAQFTGGVATCSTRVDGTCEVTFTSTTPGAVVVHGYVPNDLGVATDVSNSPLTTVFNVGDNPSKELSEISASPKTVIANGTDASTITVTLKDQYGNVIQNSAKDIAITANLGDKGAITHNADGTYTMPLTSTQSGTATVGFTINGEAANATDTVNFTVSAFCASCSTWTVTPHTSATDPSLTPNVPIANGNVTNNDYYTAVLTARDNNNNLMTNLDPGSIVFAINPTLPLVQVSPVTNTGSGTYTATFTSARVANPAQTASVTFDGSGKVGATAAQQDLPIPFQADVICIPTPTDQCFSDPDRRTSASVAPNGAVADGTSTDRINVQAFDRWGNPVAATFTLTPLDQPITLASSSVAVTSETGKNSTTATSTTDGTYRVQVKVGQTELIESPLNVIFVLGQVAPNSTLVVDPSTQTVGQNVTATLTAKDSSGNNLPGIPMTVTVDKNATATGDTTTGKTVSCITVSTGSCTVTITDNKAEDVIVHGTANIGGVDTDITGSPTTVTFIPGPVDLTKSTIEANPTRVLADNTSTSTVKVTLKDQYENVVTVSHIVEMTPTLGTLSAVTQNSDGTYSATLKAGTVGTSTITYKSDGATGTGTASVEFYIDEQIFTEGNSTFTVTPTTSAGTYPASEGLLAGVPIANGDPATDYWTGTLVAHDQTDAAMLNMDLSTIHFAVDSASAANVTISSVTNAGNGSYTVKFTTTTASTPQASVTVGTSTTKVGPSGDLPIQFQAGPLCVPDQAGSPAPCTPDNPADVTSAWVDPDGALADGIATDTLNVKSFDANGNPRGATFVLNSTDGLVTLARTTVTTTVAANQSFATGTSSVVGGHPVSVTANGKTLAESPVTMTYIPSGVDPETSTLDVNRTTQTVGQPVVATVTARDSELHTLSGIPIVVTVDQSATLINGTTAKSHNCVTGTDGTCQISLTDETAEQMQVTAKIGTQEINGSPKSVTFTHDVADPTTSEITALPASRNATGLDASVVTVTLKDKYGNRIPTGGDTVTITKTLGDTTAVLDNGDGTYTSDLTSTEPGTSTVGFTVNGATGAKTANVNFINVRSPSEFCLDCSTFTVSPTSTASKDSRLTPGVPIANGNASTDYWTGTLTANDQYNQPMLALNTSTIHFAVDSASAGNVTISSVVNNGDGTYTVKFTSKTAATPQASVTVGVSDKVGPTADLPIRFQADVVCVPDAAGSPAPCTPTDPTHVTSAWVDPNGALANGIAVDTLHVASYDTNGNATGATFVLNSTDGTVNLVSTSLTTTAANNANTTNGTSNIVGSHPVSVTADGKPLPVVNMNYNPSDVSKDLSTLVVDRTTQTVGQPVVATVTARDADNHTMPNVSVVVSVGQSATLINGDSPTSHTCVTGPAGTCQISLTDTVAEAAQVRATINGGQDINGSPKMVTFTADPTPDKNMSEITAVPSERVANGSEASLVTVTLKDQYGNRIMSGATTVTMNTTRGNLTSVSNKGDGTYTANLTSTTAGTATVGFTLNGEAAAKTADVEFTSGDFCASNSTWTVAPTTTATSGTAPVANGNAATDYWTGTLNAKDCYGVSLPNLNPALVHFTASSSDVTISQVVNNNDGSYSAKFTSTVAGTPTANVSYDTSANVNTTNREIAFQAGPICIPTPTDQCSGEQATMTRAWVDPNNALNDGTATDTLNVQAFDRFKNPVAATFVLTSNDGQVALASTSVDVLAGNGKSSTTGTSRVVGDHPVAVTVNGTALEESPVTMNFTQTPVSSTQSSLVVDRTTQTAGSPVVATVTARDSGRQIVPGASVQITVTDSATIGAPGTSVSTYECVTGPDGICTVNITDTVAERISVSATVNDNGKKDINGSPVSVNFVAGVADPTKSEIAANPTDVVNSGTDASVILVTLKDQYGNQLPAGGDTVTITKTLGNLSAVADNRDGTYKANLTSTRAGVSTLGFTVNGATGTQTATVTFTDTTAPAAPTVTSPKPGDYLKDPTPDVVGTAEPGSTVTVTDKATGQQICQTTADQNGNFTCTPTNDLSDGPHTLSVTAADESGNVSPATEVPITIDTVAPDAPTITTANGTEISGKSEPDAIIKVTVPGVTDPVLTTADGDGNWLIPTPPNAQDGTVRATATDKAGNESPEATHPLDVTPPATPTIDKANKTEISGSVPGETSGTVTVTVPGVANPITTTINPDGTWKIDTPADATDGTVKAIATDPAGNKSPEATAPLDVTPPATPTIDKANKTEISGTVPGETGGTVTVTVPGVANPITTTINPDGTWHITTPSDAIDGTVKATATDPAGNTSPEATAQLDVTPPQQPTIDKANGTEISGKAPGETSGTVTITVPGVTTPITTPVQPDGTWKITTPTGAQDGTVTAKVTDPAGNDSPPASAHLDVTAPDAPVIQQADGNIIKGTAEPGSTVRIWVPGVDQPITVVAAPGTGAWQIDTPEGATDGTVRANATDPAGNVSPDATAPIDVTPPAQPEVNDTNGTEVSGTGDPGSKITVIDENDNEVPGCTDVLIDEDGNFSCKPDTPLTPGSTIKVIARDNSGIDSPPTIKKIQAVGIEVAYPERHRLETQVVTGTAFNSGEQVCLVVHSDPVDLGCAAADEKGSVTFTFQVPSTMDLGAHTVTLTGKDSKLSASASFTVIDTVSVKTGGTAQTSNDGILFGVLIMLAAGGAGVAWSIRRMKANN